MARQKVIKMDCRSDYQVYEVAEKLKVILSGMLEEVRDIDYPMQDFLAEAKWQIKCADNLSPSEQAGVCKRQVEEVLGVIDSRKKLKETDPDFDDEMVMVADMVRGYAFKGYDDELKSCARKIKEVADRVLKGWKKNNSMKDFHRLLARFAKEGSKAVKGNHWSPWWEYEKSGVDDYCLSQGYLAAWLERKYWNK